MNRIDTIREECNLGLLQATEVVRKISNLIADELETQSELLDLEGDLYAQINGLRLATKIIRNYTD